MTPRRPPGAAERRSDDGWGRVGPGERGSAERGVSDLVGFVLVFSLIAAVVSIVSLAGLSSLEDARDAQQTDNAELAMEVLSDNVADITERGAPSRATEISLSDASLTLADPIQVEVRDPTGPPDESFLATRTFNVRPVVYDDGDTQLVYVMGAIFRAERQGGTVVQPWSPVVDSDRMMVQVVNTGSATDGLQLIESSTVLVRANGNQRVVVAADETGAYDDIWINVTSPRRDLWHRMLDDHPAMDCSTAGPETVECEVTVDPQDLYVVEHRIAVDFEK
ncbi:DUF7289 family protein [Halosimplex halobium]|uniref:DUF7289 family protein n=1 Tax=Halosimplex halobium TaxID=3396618 RepID=UPI003F579E61